MKFYISQTIGIGTEDDPHRPVIDDYIKSWRAVDMRNNPTKSGVMFIECNPSNIIHDKIILDPSVSFINTGDIGLADEIGLNPNIKSMLDDLELSQVPVDDFTSKTLLREVLQRVTKRFLIRQLLGNADMPNGLDEFLTSTQQTVAQEKATQMGVNPDLTKSSRDIIKEVSSLNHPLLQTQYGN